MPFLPNVQLADQLAADPAFLEGLRADAEERLVPAARALAPADTGSYRDSIEAVVEDGKVLVRASGEDPVRAGWIEFGTQTMPAHAPLRRGAEAAGYRLAAAGSE